MTLQKKTQLPLSMGDAEKNELRTQFGAICYKVVDGKVKILLITSRRSGRWIIPKGWPMDQKRPAAAAKREAYEEAGVLGTAFDISIGLYTYVKNLPGEDNLPCLVAVFPVHVEKLLKKYPERAQRKRRWFSPKKAAMKVDEPELARLLKTFDPTHWRLS